MTSEEIVDMTLAILKPPKKEERYYGYYARKRN